MHKAFHHCVILKIDYFKKNQYVERKWSIGYGIQHDVKNKTKVNKRQAVKSKE